VVKPKPKPKPKPPVVKPKPKPKPKPPVVKPKPKPPVGKPKPPAPFVGGDPSEVEAYLFNKVNEIRIANGVAPLIWNNRLGRAAQLHCENMFARDIFDHVIDGLGPSDRALAQGYPGGRVGENIGRIFGYDNAADMVVAGWVHSPGHLENLLDPRYLETGIGARSNDAGWTVYTQDFGTPQPAQTKPGRRRLIRGR
jgi:uncharacterized protein YkwD